MRKRRTTITLSMLALVAVLATLPGSAGARQPTPEAARRWRTIASQGFEASTFPGGKWSTRDANGAGVGGLLEWDDTPTKARTGYWSMHPNDAGSYANLTDTWATYGPIDLRGAQDARVRFSYWLDTERRFDFFTWEFSCRDNGNWTSRSVSGQVPRWVDVTMSLRPCRGSSNAFVRWTFRSDHSNTAGGVWVDDIKIQKFA